MSTAPLATDPAEMQARLTTAVEAGDCAGAIDAMLDLVSWSVGAPGISQRVREILEPYSA